MNWPKTMTVRQAKKYEKACTIIRKKQGSYNNMALSLAERTGVPITGQGVREWFITCRMPVHYAVLFVDLADGEVELFDLVPWLTPFIHRQVIQKMEDSGDIVRM
jgi:hypothetical protein